MLVDSGTAGFEPTHHGSTRLSYVLALSIEMIGRWFPISTFRCALKRSPFTGSPLQAAPIISIHTAQMKYPHFTARLSAQYHASGSLPCALKQ
jgi:hypothetical protein